MDPLKMLEAVVRGHRHTHYDRTIAVRKMAYSYATGENQREEVERYKPSEKKRLKQQRYNLYNPLTKWVLNRPRKYWQKLPQTEGVNLSINSESTRLSELLQIVERFTDRESLLEWTCKVLENMGMTDPNGWVVYDRDDKRGEGGAIVETKVVPVVYSCADVLDFKTKMGRVEYVIVRETRLEKVTNAAEQEFWKLFLFVPGMVFVMDEVSPSRPAAYYPDAEKVGIEIDGKQPRTFHYWMVENGTTEVPAAPAGSYGDDMTGLATYVPWFDPAEHVLRDLIKNKSLKDTYDVVCAFFKRYEYTKACTHRHKEKGACIAGWYNGVQEEANRCDVCKGSGKLANHTSEQEVLQLAMPKNASEFLELSKLYHNEPIDTAFGEYLRAEIDRAADMVLTAALNTGIVEKATGAATATEKNYDYQDLYDLLRPYEKTVEAHIELAIRLAAQYKEIDAQVDFRFPKDKKMKPVATLIQDLQQARSAGAPYNVIEQIQMELLEKTGEDNPVTQMAAKARLQWQPFADKSPEMLAMIIGARAADDFDRVLYENFMTIFREIESENTAPAFHEMAYPMQKKVVTDKVAEIQSTIKLAGAFAPVPFEPQPE